MGLTHLRKFSTTYYKDKVASVDVAQIPAGSATVNVYKQGATVTSGGTVTTGGITLSVRAANGLVAGDTVQRGTTSADQMTVDSIVSETSITIHSTTGSSIVLNAGDRLVPYSARPTLYSEPTGVATTANPTSTNSAGYVKFYVNARIFDVIVSGTGITTTLYIDEESGLLVPRRSHYNVMDFATPAIALASIPAGARLYFPLDGGPYTPPDNDGWTITKAVEIYSDSEHPINGNLDECFRFYGSIGDGHKDSTIFTVAAGVNRVYFHDFMINSHGASRVTATNGTGDGIRLDTTGSTIGFIRIERVAIDNAGRSGIRTTGTVGYLNRLTIRDVRVALCQGVGVYLRQIASLQIAESWVTDCYLAGAYLKDCGQGLVQLTCGANGAGHSSTTLEGQVILDTCAELNVTGGNFEGFTTGTCKNAIVLLGTRGCVIGANEFDNSRDPQNANSRGIYLRDGSYGNTILSNNFADVDKAVEIDSAANDVGNIVMPQAIQGGDANGTCRVVLPTGGRNFGFMTDLTAGVGDRKGVGLLLPSHPDHTTIDSSVVQDGLLVYNSTTDKLMIRANGAWAIVGTQS